MENPLWNCIKIRQMTKFFKRDCQKRVKNLTSEWNKKLQHFFPHASRSLLCKFRLCRCSFSVWRISFLKKGTPRDLFRWPSPRDPPLSGSGRKTTTLVHGTIEYFRGPTQTPCHQRAHQAVRICWRIEVENVPIQSLARYARTTDDGRTPRFDGLYVRTDNTLISVR